MKRCSENMQQIYSRTPMPKCGSSKVALYWNHTSAWVFSCKFAEYFHNTYGGLFLHSGLMLFFISYRDIFKRSSLRREDDGLLKGSLENGIWRKRVKSGKLKIFNFMEHPERAEEVSRSEKGPIRKNVELFSPRCS